MNKKIKTIIKIVTSILTCAILFAVSAPIIVPAEDQQISDIVKASIAAEVSPTITSVITTATTTIRTDAITTTINSTTSTILNTETTTTITSTNEVEEVASVGIISTTEAAQELINEQETKTEIKTEEYVVYKPSTHYLHRSTCHWVDETCEQTFDTVGLRCRKCSECNPDMEIIDLYEEPINTTGISDYDKQLLAEITCHEYGSSWVSTAEKAKIVAGVMNRVYSASYPSTVYGVLMQDGQFHGSWDGGHGYWPGCITPTDDCWAAVDYYFAHQSEFGSWTSWYGDGTWNYFY